MLVVGLQLRFLCADAICAIKCYAAMQCRGKTKLGVNHPDTLQSFNNLGMVLHAHGHLAEAERLLRDALQRSPGAQLQRFQRGLWAVDLESRSFVNFKRWF